MVMSNNQPFFDDDLPGENPLDKTLSTLRHVRNHRLAASKRKLFKEKRLLQCLEKSLHHEQLIADTQYRHYQAIRRSFVFDLQKSNNHKQELAVRLDNELTEKRRLAGIKENILAMEQQKQAQHESLKLISNQVRQHEIKVEKLDYLYPKL